MPVQDDGPAILSYADVSTAAGVDDSARRLTVAPPAGLRSLGGFRIATPIFAGLMFFGVVDGLLIRGGMVDVIAPMTVLGVPFTIMVLVALDRRYRRVTFDVSPREFRLTVIGPFGTTHAGWPRSAVLGIRVSHVNKRLYIQIAGEDQVSVYLGPDLAANELVMHELVAAQTAVLPAPPGAKRPADQNNGARWSLARLLEPQKKDFWA